MYKKILVPVILALAAALVIGGAAYAASQPGQTATPAAEATQANPSGAGNTAAAAQSGAATLRRARIGLGQITALGEDAFTVRRRNGVETAIHVDAQTRYLHANGSPSSFADLQVGRWVLGRVVPSANGPLARLVVLLPAGFDPATLVRHVGRVTVIDTSSFTIWARDGQPYTFQVTPETLFLGRGGAVKGLRDLRLGMPVGILARNAGGELRALVVLARR